MFRPARSRALQRNDERIILHFDYDCFYASVFEAENPALKALPLAVQQKHIIVTCNYEARRRGLQKLQLITEAKKVCPDVIIVLGEDLTRFRDASKTLYNFIRKFAWSDRAEKLGFDEVFLDVTDAVNYNVGVLNRSDLQRSFFHLSENDPTVGFKFDASKFAGYTFPSSCAHSSYHEAEDRLNLRLKLGSHMAMHIREQLEEHMGYTSTVGISTSKLLSKLVGNVNKPMRQTSLLPPYEPDQEDQSNVFTFLDDHDVGAIPGIGFKLAQKIRGYALGRPEDFPSKHNGYWGIEREKIKVGQVRSLPKLDPQSLENLLTGPGSAHGIGEKIYALLHGIDDSEVGQAREVPRQISIEDSYIRLDTMEQAVQQLRHLSARLIQRMRIDLTEVETDATADDEGNDSHQRTRWIGRPETLRLSTRPRLPLSDDGTRARTFKRISKSTDLPRYVFNLQETPESLAGKLVSDILLPLFKKLHPEKSGWNLSLVNVAVSNMGPAGGETKNATGRDIEKMFKKQDGVLAAFRVTDERGAATATGDNVGGLATTDIDRYADLPMTDAQTPGEMEEATEEAFRNEDSVESDNMADDDPSTELEFRCQTCGLTLPTFAKGAHSRYHSMSE